MSTNTNAWKSEFLLKADRYHKIAAWVGIVLNLVWFISDYFDIPYLYYRISRVLGEDFANALSPIDVVKDESAWNRNGWLNIAGVESLDFPFFSEVFVE